MISLQLQLKSFYHDHEIKIRPLKKQANSNEWESFLTLLRITAKYMRHLIETITHLLLFFLHSEVYEKKICAHLIT